MASSLPVVVGAAILDGTPPGVRVLAAQRGAEMVLPWAWEFPGGKVEAGESEPEALRRECVEELGVEIRVGERIGPEVEVAGGRFVLRVWTAWITAGEPRLVEHAAFRWLAAGELFSVEWAPPDQPVVEALERLLRGE